LEGLWLKIPFVDLGAQYQSMKDQIDNAIKNVINETAFIGGKYVTAFEEEYAAYIGSKHCIGVGNGTDGLYLAMKALDIGPQDEVIVPANTFIGTSEAVSMTGARVVFADCDPQTYTVTTETIGRAITPKTKAVIPVHLYGNPAPVLELREFADQKKLFLIEDAAQAHGAEYKDKRIGTFGHAAVFSFYPGKNLGAYGDAGCVVTNDDNLAKKIRMLANHGRVKKYDHEFEGQNSRLDGLQAAILSVKLKHLDRWTKQRRDLAKRYCKKLESLPLVLPVETKGGKHVYHLFVIRLNNRESVREYLESNGVKTGIHYPISLPELKAYRHLNLDMKNFPNSKEFAGEVLSLPMFPEMTEEQLDYICRILEEAIKIYGA
jgi:dTDP-4-amino-4,6-dideoxygalactose transaminase